MRLRSTTFGNFARRIRLGSARGSASTVTRAFGRKSVDNRFMTLRMAQFLATTPRCVKPGHATWTGERGVSGFMWGPNMRAGKICLLAAMLSVVGTSNSVAQCWCWVNVPEPLSLNIEKRNQGVISHLRRGEWVWRRDARNDDWTHVQGRNWDQNGYVRAGYLRSRSGDYCLLRLGCAWGSDRPNFGFTPTQQQPDPNEKPTSQGNYPKH
jgi:hypothetical protein